MMDTEFHIRKAKDKDIDEIMALYEQARAYMAENGNPGQWTNGYPAREDVETDLNRNVLYICESSDGIEGVFMYCIGEEPNYREIEGGCWLNEEPYGFLHRIASAGRKKGVATFCVQWCLTRCKNMRGDTHQKIRPCRECLKKMVSNPAELYIWKTEHRESHTRRRWDHEKCCVGDRTPCAQKAV